MNTAFLTHLEADFILGKLKEEHEERQKSKGGTSLESMAAAFLASRKGKTNSDVEPEHGRVTKDKTRIEKIQRRRENLIRERDNKAR